MKRSLELCVAWPRSHARAAEDIWTRRLSSERPACAAVRDGAKSVRKRTWLSKTPLTPSAWDRARVAARRGAGSPPSSASSRSAQGTRRVSSGKSSVGFAYWLYGFINGDPTVHPHVGKGIPAGWWTDRVAIFVSFSCNFSIFWFFLVQSYSEKGLFHSILMFGF